MIGSPCIRRRSRHLLPYTVISLPTSKLSVVAAFSILFIGIESSEPCVVCACRRDACTVRSRKRSTQCKHDLNTPTQSLPPRRSRRLLKDLPTTNQGAGGRRLDVAMPASMSESTSEDTKTEDLERQAGSLFSFLCPCANFYFVGFTMPLCLLGLHCIWEVANAALAGKP